jgi:hypothetical protein
VNTASSDLPHHLRILLERLQHPTDYEKAFHYFIEEFGGDREFIGMGEPEKLPLLVKVMEVIASKMLSKDAPVERLRLSAVPGHGFHHGSAAVDGRAVVVFYFESANQGLMVMIPGARGAAEFARFSLPSSLPVNPSSN